MSAITATVQLRRDTAANWTANNPTLLAGEVGIETDTRRMKFGNGTQTWTALAYAQGTAAQEDVSAFVTPTGSQTLTNKTIDSFTNTVEADTIHIQVRNVSGATILKGSPVYVSGFNLGQLLPQVELADASSAATMPALGLAEADIPNNTNGAVDRIGLLTNVNTVAWPVGTLLYVSETTGTLTSTAPTGAALVQPIATVLRSNAVNGVLEVNDRGVTDLTAAEAAAAYLAKSANLSDIASAATARTNLGLGTNALINGAPSYITYSGGSQATTSTSFADVHSSAGWSGLAPGMYIGEFYILYDASATTTGARFGLNGTVTQDYLTIFVGYSTLAGDRSSAQTGTFDGGAAAPSSTVTSGNSAVVQFTINVMVTGDIVLRFSTEVGGSAITVTNVIGFIRRVA